jgi:hypothetical protein
MDLLAVVQRAFSLFLWLGNNDNARGVEYIDAQLLNEARRIP